MSYLDWFVGMKVVCVAEGEEAWCSIADNFTSPDYEFPVNGRVYTIREIGIDGDNVGITVREIADQFRNGNQIAFLAECFRPLNQHKTDISIFTAMLTDTKQKVPA